jgi:serpin B
MRGRTWIASLLLGTICAVLIVGSWGPTTPTTPTWRPPPQFSPRLAGDYAFEAPYAPYRETRPDYEVALEPLTPQRDRFPSASAADVAQLTAGNARFAFRLAREMAKGERGNLCISPSGLEVGFALLSAGARGETLAEIRRTLDFGAPEERLHATVNKLDLSLRALSPSVRLQAADGLWLSKDCELVPSLLDLADRHYTATVRRAAFPQPGYQEINEWAANRTSGRFADVVSSDSLDVFTAIAVVDVLYFRSLWEHPFPATGQSADTQFAAPSGPVPVRALRQTATFGYGEVQIDGRTCQVVSLPYRLPSVSLVVIVPPEGVEPLASEGWGGEAVGRAIANLAARPVEVVLPRWSQRSSADLLPALRALGIQRAFGHEAEFGGLIERQTQWVGRVQHGVQFDVTESGTEPSGGSRAPAAAEASGEAVSVHADHPFLYLVREAKTGQVLLLGRVMEPREDG